MPDFAGPDEAFAFLDDMLARLRHRSPDDDSHLYTRMSASVCASDMRAIEAALDCISISLTEGVNRCVRRGVRDSYRLRLLELRYELTELEEALARDRAQVNQQRRQLQAATAWNESAHRV